MKVAGILGIVVALCLANGAMAGWTTSGNNMYSDVSGNVGIGTSKPDTKLDVNGTFRVSDAVVFGTNSGATSWQMWNEGPGEGPLWFPAFSGQDYDAKINLWDLTNPAPNGRALFVVAGEPADVDMIVDGDFGALGGLWVGRNLMVGAPGNWQVTNTRARKGPEWFGYFSNQDYDASMEIMDVVNPAPTNRSYLIVGGVHTDTDLIVDGRLGLLGNLVVGYSGQSLFADTGTGNVGIGTTAPTTKLDVNGYVKAQGYYTGDLFFQKDGRTLWRMYEDKAGLYVENVASGKKYDVVLRESGQAQSTDENAAIAQLKQKVADLEAKLDALAKKLP